VRRPSQPAVAAGTGATADDRLLGEAGDRLPEEADAASAEDGATGTAAPAAPPAERPLPPAAPSRWALARALVAMGCIVFATTSLRQFGVNNLPGSLFGLLISTSIIFNVILSAVLLGRRYNAWHYAAVALGVAAVLVLGLMDLEQSGSPEHSASYNFPLGTSCALGAGLFIALMSVWSSKVTSSWPDKELRVIELTIAGALVAAILLVPLLFATGEQADWRPQLSAAWERHRSLLICVTLAMPVAKALVRWSKYATIAHSSALFFEFTQATANIVSSLANVFLFGETWTGGFLIGTFLMVLAFAAYIRGAVVQQARAPAAGGRGIAGRADGRQGRLQAVLAGVRGRLSRRGREARADGLAVAAGAAKPDLPPGFGAAESKAAYGDWPPAQVVLREAGAR
jgi:drug/metabolite transporter (DMT)-like permease